MLGRAYGGCTRGALWVRKGVQGSRHGNHEYESERSCPGQGGHMRSVTGQNDAWECTRGALWIRDSMCKADQVRRNAWGCAKGVMQIREVV